MSEESKAIFDKVTNEAFILDKALEIAKAYAGSTNANPDYAVELIENIVHLLASGERKRD